MSAVANTPAPFRVSHPRLRLLGSLLRRAFACAVLLALVGLLNLYVRGLPKPLEARLLRRINAGAFALKVDTFILRPHDGLVARGATVYQKGVMGDPLFQAEEVALDINPMAWMNKDPLIAACTIRRGVFRRAQARPPRKDAGAPMRAVSLRFTLEQCRFEGMEIARASGRYELAGDIMRLRDLRGTAGEAGGGGAFTGDFTFNLRERTYRCSIDSRVAPSGVLPLLRGRGLRGATDVLERLAFHGEPPHCIIRFEGGLEPLYHLFDGRLFAERCAYRDVDLERLDAGVRLDLGPNHTLLRLAPLNAECDGRSIVAECDLDLVAGEVAVNAMSTMDAIDVAHLIHPALEAIVRRFRFEKPPAVSVRGVYAYKHPENTRLTARVEGRQLGFGAAIMDDCSFDLALDGRTGTVRNVKGSLWGGAVELAGAFYPDSESTNLGYTVTGYGRDVSVEALARNLAHKSGAHFSGFLSVTGALSGTTGPLWTNTVAGSLNLRLEEGQLLTIPLFGGLTEILTKHIPLLDRALELTRVSADLLVDAGRLHTDRIAIDGRLLRIEGRGSCGFDRSLDFVVEVTVRDKSLAQKLIRLPFDLLNQLFFEIRLSGTLDQPTWYLRRFSRELLEKFGIGGKE